MMKRSLALLLILLFICTTTLYAENFRTVIVGSSEVSAQIPDGTALNLSYIDSLLVYLHDDLRFLRGVEIELTVPQLYLQYRGSLAVALYADIIDGAETGVADVNARQLSIEPIPSKIQTIYQIPIVNDHGLRSSPYASLPAGVLLPASFPMLIRIMPVIKGLSDRIETMKFQINARPIFNDLGAVRIIPRYPQMLQGKPFTVIIDDTVIDNLDEELLLAEGDHNLAVISNDYRNESKRFIVEKSKVLDLAIELQDPTPLIIFAVPENTRVFFNNQQVTNIKMPYPTVPGEHQVRFQVGDYSIIKPLFIEKGKTYHVDLAIDVVVSENE
jgi:hypothetical protein